MKTIKSLALLTIFGICLYILFFKSEWLVNPLLEKPPVPLGSLIAWVLITTYSLFMSSISPDDLKTRFEKFSKRVLRCLLYPSFFWGIVSFVLSGNWAFNFENKINFTVWIIYTALILILPLVIVVFLFIGRWFTSNK